MLYTYFVFILKQSHSNASNLKNCTESCYLMVFNDSKAGPCGQACFYNCFLLLSTCHERNPLDFGVMSTRRTCCGNMITT